MTIGHNGLGIDPRMNNILSSAYDLDAPGYVCFPPNTINYYGGGNLGTNAPLRTPALTSDPDAYITQKRPNKNVLPAILGFGALAAALLLLLKKGKVGGKGQKSVMKRIRNFFGNIFHKGKAKSASGSGKTRSVKGAGKGRVNVKNNGANRPQKTQVPQNTNVQKLQTTQLTPAAVPPVKPITGEIVETQAKQITRVPSFKKQTEEIITIDPSQIRTIPKSIANLLHTPKTVLELTGPEKIAQKAIKGLPASKTPLALPAPRSTKINILPSSGKTIITPPAKVNKLKTPKVRIKKGTNPYQTNFDFIDDIPVEKQPRIKRNTSAKKLKNTKSPALEQLEFNFEQQTAATKVATTANKKATKTASKNADKVSNKTTAKKTEKSILEQSVFNFEQQPVATKVATTANKKATKTASKNANKIAKQTTKKTTTKQKTGQKKEIIHTVSGKQQAIAGVKNSQNVTIVQVLVDTHKKIEGKISNAIKTATGRKAKSKKIKNPLLRKLVNGLLKGEKESLEYAKENKILVPFTKRITKTGLAKRLKKSIRAVLKQYNDNSTAISSDLKYFLKDNQKFQKI